MRVLLVALCVLCACSAPGTAPNRAAADSARSARTGSSGTVVYGRDLVAAGSVDLEQALIARVPGLQIINWQGRPTLVIRGVNTILGDPSPRYVVDGMVLAPGSLSPLRTLSVYDIDRIEVLKSAADTIQYGGSNGVIRIWTRRADAYEPDSTGG